MSKLSEMLKNSHTGVCTEVIPFQNPYQNSRGSLIFLTPCSLSRIPTFARQLYLGPSFKKADIKIYFYNSLDKLLQKNTFKAVYTRKLYLSTLFSKLSFLSVYIALNINILTSSYKSNKNKHDIKIFTMCFASF